MKHTLKSRALMTGLIIALLCFVVGPFGVKAPALAGANAAPASVGSNKTALPALTDDGPFVPPDLLKNEAENIQRFALSLIEYQDHFDAVTSATKPDPRQIAAVETQLKDLRSRFPQFQSSAEAVVPKLKKAKKWTDELDSFFETTAAKKNLPSEFVESVKRQGGARRFIEKSVLSLKGLPAQFDNDEKVLNELRNSKVGWLNWVESWVVPRVSAKNGNWSCATCNTLSVYMIVDALTFNWGAEAAIAQQFLNNGHCYHACP